MYSITYRGTPDNPGLVLALNPQKSSFCDGVAFQVSPETAKETLAYLRERELVTSAYVENIQPVTLESGTTVDAICYVIDQNHRQYTGNICLEDQADIIARSSGNTGPNWEYLFNTADHLCQIGIADPELDQLVEMVKSLRLS